MVRVTILHPDGEQSTTKIVSPNYDELHRQVKKGIIKSFIVSLV